MNTITKTHVDKLLAFCQTICPNQSAADGFSKMVEDMEDDKCDPCFQVKTLARGIVDALAYGNWPEL